MSPNDSMGDADRQQLRLRELCEKAQGEADFDHLALIVEEILSVIAKKQAKSRDNA